MKKRPHIAVIGAGLAGLTAARELRTDGAAVTVFEKSRGPGGRLATRRPFGREDPLGIDHGAPFAQAEHAGTLAALIELGQPWAPNGGPTLGAIGVPGMNDLVKPIAEGLRLITETEIQEIARGPEDWLLIDAADGRHGPFDGVAVAVPAPQAAGLLGETCGDVQKAEMRPCWTLLLAYETVDIAPVELLRPAEGPLELIIQNSAKPGRGLERAAQAQTWAAHATAEWSIAHLEMSKEEAAEQLYTLALEIAPLPKAVPAYRAAHRWRYSQTTKTVGRAYWLSTEGDLGCCGDWRLGPNAGDAYRSGLMLGRAMAERIV
ncbi:MAG: FAD-dependent oxidoreductase, partial [Rhodobacteraceae bacterium]|nr:FAD-dependent oxidoreductase [Paracoccaceae bacterium]